MAQLFEAAGVARSERNIVNWHIPDLTFLRQIISILNINLAKGSIRPT